MKTVCPICGTRSATRRCKRREMTDICPLCCAGVRDDDCDDCVYWTAAQEYQGEHGRTGPLRDGHFIAEIDPEVEQAVNGAVELAQRGNMEQAQEALERLLREHPANHTVHFGMGVLHAIRGENRQAMQWFDKATVIFPYFVEAHFNKAVACQAELDVAGAVRAYRKVVEVGDPNEGEVKRAKVFLERMAEAIRKSDGVDLDTYLESQDAFNRAFALMEQGDWERALAGFRAAAAKNDRNAPTHGNIALCLAKLGRKAEALKELDRANEIDSRYEPARSNRVVVERMEEGKPLESARFERIEFSRDQLLRRRGRARSVRDWFATFRRDSSGSDAGSGDGFSTR